MFWYNFDLTRIALVQEKTKLTNFYQLLLKLVGLSYSYIYMQPFIVNYYS